MMSASKARDFMGRSVRYGFSCQRRKKKVYLRGCIMSIFTKIFGDPNERVVKELRPMIEEINALEPEFEKLSDEDLPKRTEELKARLASRFKSALPSEALAKEGFAASDGESLES